MKQKRVLAALLAVTLLVSASGCRKSNTSGGNESDEYYWSTIEYGSDWTDTAGEGTQSGGTTSGGSSGGSTSTVVRGQAHREKQGLHDR